MLDKKLGWHILPASMRLGHGDNRVARVGETLSVAGRICSFPVIKNGEAALHASPSADIALFLAPQIDEPFVFCRVELWGDVLEAFGAWMGRYRKLLWYVPADQSMKIAFEWATSRVENTIERLLAAGRPLHPRNQESLRQIRRWLNGQITICNLGDFGYTEVEDTLAALISAIYFLSIADYSTAVDSLMKAVHFSVEADTTFAWKLSMQDLSGNYFSKEHSPDYHIIREGIRLENRTVLERMLESSAVFS